MSLRGSILTLNAGSSSLKFALFDTAAELKATARGEIEDLDAAPHLLARDAAGAVVAERRWPAGAALPFAVVLDTLLDFADAHLGHDGLAAVGHRVVHGGADHIAPAVITPALLAALEAAAAATPEQHLVDIDDVGDLAAFLVSDSARHMTGTIIPVDGGQHLIA